MKFLKSLVAVFACSVLLALLCGCTLLMSKRIETPDTNGEDDHSLAVLTEDYIRNEKSDCYCVVYGFHPEGDSSYPDEEYWHDAAYTKASAVSAMSGVSLLQMTYGTEDTIVFAVESLRTEGNLRIVLLDGERNILYDFDIEGTSSYTVEHAKGKTFEILAVGESAKFVIKTSREFISE